MAISFSTPRCKLQFEKSNFQDNKSSHNRNVSTHYYNHGIDIFLPAVDSVPTELAQIFRDERFFMLKDVQLKRLIAPEFIGAFVKKGSLCMFTHQNQIDVHNCVAITPNGELILNLDKDTYEELGLDGKPSEFNCRRSRKFVVTIKLCDEKFKPGGKSYERVSACFERMSHLKFNFLLTWTPPEDNICPSSIAAYFDSLRCLSTKFQLSRESKCEKVAYPICDLKYDKGTEDDDDIFAIYEWLGAVTNEIDSMEPDPDGITSSYEMPDIAVLRKQYCSRLRLRGMISPGNVLHALDWIRDYMLTSKSTWASFTVHGFADSPISRNCLEHTYQLHGDNLYTYVVFKGHDYWLFTAD